MDASEFERIFIFYQMEDCLFNNANGLLVVCFFFCYILNNKNINSFLILKVFLLIV